MACPLQRRTSTTLGSTGEQLDAERLEEGLILKAHEQGLFGIVRQTDADPRAVLACNLAAADKPMA
jgi:hypothetical protein